MDINVACTNMLKQQLRTAGVVDETLLRLFEMVKRELFVPADFQKVAYADTFIPLDHGQIMFSPVLEATMLQALAIQPQDKILEIGTGSGFITALLAQLAHSVISIDIFPDFMEKARANLNQLEINNARLHMGNGAKGWGQHQFDVILVTGSVTIVPQELLAQLTPNGRLFVIAGSAPVMRAQIMQRQADQIVTHTLFETKVPPLLQAPQAELFVF